MNGQHGKEQMQLVQRRAPQHQQQHISHPAQSYQNPARVQLPARLQAKRWPKVHPRMQQMQRMRRGVLETQLQRQKLLQ